MRLRMWPDSTVRLIPVMNDAEVLPECPNAPHAIHVHEGLPATTLRAVVFLHLEALELREDHIGDRTLLRPIPAIGDNLFNGKLRRAVRVRQYPLPDELIPSVPLLYRISAVAEQLAVAPDTVDGAVLH